MYKILWYEKGQDRDNAVIYEGYPFDISENEIRRMVQDLNQKYPKLHHFFQWVSDR